MILFYHVLPSGGWLDIGKTEGDPSRDRKNRKFQIFVIKQDGDRYILDHFILYPTRYHYILADQNMQISASQCFEFPFKVYWISFHPVDELRMYD